MPAPQDSDCTLRPDFTFHFDADLRYVWFERITPGVEVLVEPHEAIGRRVSDVVDRRLTHLLAGAAQVAIGRGAPVYIQYTMDIRGRHWRSRARVTAPAAEKIIIVEVERLAGADQAQQRA